MTINWKIFKVVLALVIIIGIVFWAIDSSRAYSYSGTNLSFDVASGPVSISNPSDQPVLAQLISTGTRSFRVSSTIEDVSGSSTRQGTGTATVHTFEFELPPGTSEFTVSGGTDVGFVSNSAITLQATVNSVSDNTLRVTILTSSVVVLVALFYASSAVRHLWLSVFRRKTSASQTQETKPTHVVSDSEQGPVVRSYGDNRGRTGD